MAARCEHGAGNVQSSWGWDDHLELGLVLWLVFELSLRLWFRRRCGLDALGDAALLDDSVREAQSRDDFQRQTLRRGVHLIDRESRSGLWSRTA